MISVFRNPTRLQANLVLVAAAFIWGTAFIGQSVVAQYGIAFVYNGVCFGLAGLLLLPFGFKKTMAPAQWKWMLSGGFLLFGGSALQQFGMYYTKVANASFLTTLYVIFTPVILFLGFREKPSPLEALGVLLAVLGAFFLSTGGAYESQWGDILETLGAVFWALHIVLIAKAAQRFEPLSFASWQFFIAGLLNFLLGVFLEDLRPLVAGPVILSTLYRAVLSIGFGYTVQIWAQRFTPPTDAGLIFALESVFAALAAWVLLGEGLQNIQILGCVLILAAASLAQIPTKKIGEKNS